MGQLRIRQASRMATTFSTRPPGNALLLRAQEPLQDGVAHFPAGAWRELLGKLDDSLKLLADSALAWLTFGT